VAFSFNWLDGEFSVAPNVCGGTRVHGDDRIRC